MNPGTVFLFGVATAASVFVIGLAYLAVRLTWLILLGAMAGAEKKKSRRGTDE